MKSLAVNTTAGVIISIIFLRGAIACFKFGYLVLGFILCAIATVSFFVAVGGKG